MSEKSYVSIARGVCVICGERYDSGILLDKTLSKSLDKYTYTEAKLCPVHRQELEDARSDGKLAHYILEVKKNVNIKHFLDANNTIPDAKILDVISGKSFLFSYNIKDGVDADPLIKGDYLVVDDLKQFKEIMDS